jgi:excisionase family DNA binding protein
MYSQDSTQPRIGDRGERARRARQSEDRRQYRQQDGIKPLALTVNKTAEITGLGVSTIWAMLKEGRLTSTSVGRRRLVHYASVERLLEGDAA